MASSRHVQSELQSSLSNSASEVSAERGKDTLLEIRKFLKDKSILITGATGFLGKILVEKVLRVQPEIKQLYLLVQPRGGLSPQQRVQSQILDIELFKVLRSKLGKEFEEFTKKKITVVGGNVRLPDLGISSEQAGAITPDLDLIMHLAANTRFDGRFDVSLRDNTLGSASMMEFAKTCPKLKLFLHLLETLGPTSTKKWSSLGEGGKQRLFLASAKWFRSVQLYGCMISDLTARCANYESMYLRAELFGWQDVYTFTKAMGEMLLFENRGHIPVAIVRPSSVMCSYKEPFPGWVEGFKVYDPIAVPYGLGQFPGFPLFENSVFDMVPVDMVVNTILAVATKHYGREQQDTFVYHSSSGSVNPLSGKEFGEAIYKHFKAYPMMDNNGNDIQVERFRCFEDADEFKRSVRSRLLSAALVRLRSSRGSNSDTDKVHQQEYAKVKSDSDKLLRRCETIGTYTKQFASFDNQNAENLRRQICQNEQETFGYSVYGVDWINFLAEVHLPGLRRHVLKKHRIQGLKQEHSQTPSRL
ncbi:hypothetical protein R1sor_016332 [Riccia sorocarpa]|uniref:Fatty acyl-CoA reductase n=1 Tax=Riccia sorocarpa TaxID=122646 RepID=A0ABD3HF52_9MARC